jgi:hypothetical protein
LSKILNNRAFAPACSRSQGLSHSDCHEDRSPSRSTPRGSESRSGRRTLFRCQRTVPSVFPSGARPDPIGCGQGNLSEPRIGVNSKVELFPGPHRRNPMGRGPVCHPGAGGEATRRPGNGGGI